MDEPADPILPDWWARIARLIGPTTTEAWLARGDVTMSLASPDLYDSADAVHPVDGPHPTQPVNALLLGVVDDASGVPPMIGQSLTIPEWRDYCAAYAFGSLPPSRLVLHHTYRPDETTWRGLSSMQAMQSYYHGLGWSSAPHIYAAPDSIWLFTPMRNIGIHAGWGNGSLAEGWYSIGLEMVGFFDDHRPTGAVWEHAKAVMGELSRVLDIAPRALISFHRNYTTEKSCPGWAVTKEWVWSDVESYLSQSPPAPGPSPYSPDSPLCSPAQGHVDAAVAYLAPRARPLYQPGDVSLIVNTYAALGESVGVDWFAALAQCAHETGSLTSWWAQRPRRNPAGLGVTGRTVDTPPEEFFHWARDPIDGHWTVVMEWAYRAQMLWWEEGLSFPTWAEHAIPAHLGRLLAYALPAGQATAAQQQLIDFALWYRDLPARYRGCAPTLKGLEGTWAVPGVGYAAKVAGVANEMARAQ